MENRCLIALACTTVVTLLMLAGAAPVRAATIVVTEAADSADNDNGFCSLREAVIAANSDAAVDGCTAGSGADVITVPAGSYTLSVAGAVEDAAFTGDLDITAAVTINGEGAAITVVNGSDLDRIFEVHSTTAAFSGLTLTNGSVTGSGGAINAVSSALTLDGVALTNNVAGESAGGGLSLQAQTGATGTLSIANSTISGNQAGCCGGGINLTSIDDPVSITAGINNTTVSGNTSEFCCGGIRSIGADLDISGSTISGNTAGTNGGGVLTSDGPLTITGSTISGNSAFTGGGIYNSGTSTTVTATTISGNFAQGQGGGIASEATLDVAGSTISGNNAVGGGAMVVTSGAGSPATITNTTVSGNNGADGPGGIYAVIETGGSVTILLTTVTANIAPGIVGAGISAVIESTGLLISHTIVAGNDVDDCRMLGTATSAGANISGDASCQFTNTAAGDAQNLDPRLGPLAANGGPTLTHALLAGSPAIDRGLAACGETTDQRGSARPTDGDDADSIAECDSGAYEAAASVPSTPPSSPPAASVPSTPPSSPPAAALPDTGTEPRGGAPWLTAAALAIATGSVLAMRLRRVDTRAPRAVESPPPRETRP